VGFDISAPETARRGRTRSADELQRAFRKQFTPREWARITAEGARGESMFRLHWSLKEAVVKARGDGIVFEMHRIEISLPSIIPETSLQPTPADEVPASTSMAAPVGLPVSTASISATMTIDGIAQPEWQLRAQLYGEHWVSTALCVPACVIDRHARFSRTFRIAAPPPPPSALAEPPLQPVSVRDLLPSAARVALDVLPL
jgi:phosphopantetheinyl transferase (holo-ACP synthase)